ncbi:hypothetical protein Tco_1538908 [Tanacetum coccineum]
MECRVRRLRRNTFISYAVTGSILINRGLIQAIPTSLPPQPIGEATKASNLQRIPPGVQGRSHFIYFLYLIIQIRVLNEVDKADDKTSNTVPCRLPKELSPGSFLLPFNINNHNFYATTTLDAKDNIMPQRVYEYLCLDKLRGRPFLESTRAQIDVLNKDISFEIGSVKIKFNIDSYQSIEKNYMVGIGQEEETLNPIEIGIDLFFYESTTCLQFKQRTISYGTPKPQDEIAGPDSLLPDRRGLVKRWHKIDDTTWEQRIWHNNLHESDRRFIFNKWILDSYNVKEAYPMEIGGRSFICITDHEDEALPLGRVNGARFKAMIRKELEGNKYVHERPEARRLLSRPARLIIMCELGDKELAGRWR